MTKLRVTILVSTIAPVVKGASSHIWHNRSDRLSTAFFSTREKKTAMCEWRPDICEPPYFKNQAVGCLVCPHSLKVRLLPQKEAGGHIELKSHWYAERKNQI